MFSSPIILGNGLWSSLPYLSSLSSHKLGAVVSSTPIPSTEDLPGRINENLFFDQYLASISKLPTEIIVSLPLTRDLPKLIKLLSNTNISKVEVDCTFKSIHTVKPYYTFDILFNSFDSDSFDLYVRTKNRDILEDISRLSALRGVVIEKLQHHEVQGLRNKYPDIEHIIPYRNSWTPETVQRFLYAGCPAVQVGSVALEQDSRLRDLTEHNYDIELY